MAAWLTRFLAVVLLASTTSPAAGQASSADCRGCGDPPGLPRIAGFHIYTARQQDLDRFEFPVASGRVEAVEGRLLYVDYYADEGRRPPTGLQIVGSYVRAAEAVGGKVVYRFEDGGTEYVTLKIPGRGGDSWVWVHGANNGMYRVTVVQPTAASPPSAPDAQPQAPPERKPLSVQIISPDEIPTGSVLRLVARLTGGEGATPTFRWTQTDGPTLRRKAGDDARSYLQEEDWRKQTLTVFPEESGIYGFQLDIVAGREELMATTSVRVMSSPAPPEPVTSTRAPGFTVNIRVSPSRVVATAPLVLGTGIEGGADGASYTYRWTQVDGDPLTPRDGWTDPWLVFVPGSLTAGATYTFEVAATSGDAVSVARVVVHVEEGGA